MTETEAKKVLNNHLEHWKRLIRGKVCDETEGYETINALNMAINALSAIEDIKQEIEKLRPNLRPEQMTDYDFAMADVFNDIVAIIDKHLKGEKE